MIQQIIVDCLSEDSFCDVNDADEVAADRTSTFCQWWWARNRDRVGM